MLTEYSWRALDLTGDASLRSRTAATPDYIDSTFEQRSRLRYEDVVAKQLTSAEDAPHIARVFDDARGTIRL